MILYYLYAAFLLLTLVLIGRIAWIQWGWKPSKEVVKYFRPVSEKSVIYPERGAIIGCDGKLLALSTPMYELFMDCTVRKDYFESKGKDGKRMEAEWQEKAKEFAKGLSAEMGGDGEIATEWFSSYMTGTRCPHIWLNCSVTTVTQLEDALPLLEGAR